MFQTRFSRRLAGIGAIVFALLLVVAGSLWWIFRDYGAKQITAYFNEAVGVYAGSDVRILGVAIGTIDSVTPDGQLVKVTMTVNGGIQVPADAEALVVSPSVVSDRYIQLAPAFTGGPQITDGAVIPVSRTETPVEIDQLYQSLDKLTTALGPNGANKNGALSDIINAGAANLQGNGQALGNMIQQLGAATRTLSGSQKDLFGTIDNLAQFTQMLSNNDSQVRGAEDQLASVTQFLSDDRQNLGAALNELASALGQVQTFIQDNEGRLKSNVDKLAAISQILVNQRASLAQALDAGPLAISNLLNAYDPAHGTLDGRGDINEYSMGPAGANAQSAPMLGLPTAGGSGSSGGGQ
ncbi:MAG TPA: MCE family protein [Pseudonocardiaceae bacterium]|nr:MCE family protein [Pseudonocardiaceae bacterium]